MSTNVSRYDQVAVLTVKDDLAGDGAEIFTDRASQCVSEGVINLVVDCAQVSAVDSSGLEAMLDLQDRCEDAFGSVKICGADETLIRILEITRLMRRFEVFDDIDAAVKSFS